MKVSIHQPQYLPWLPYFLKIDECDLFIILDTVDYQKNGLQNRNQIKTSQGAQWLTVPVLHNLGQKILATKIDNTTKWKKKHWQTIRQCYSKAESFKQYADELDGIYTNDWSSLAELNVELINRLLCWLNINTKIIRSSDMKATGIASDLVLKLCLEAGATHYVSGTGGMDYLRSKDFEQAGIRVDYRHSVLPETYSQPFPKIGFINHLSALDIVLNCGDKWRDYLPKEPK